MFSLKTVNTILYCAEWEESVRFYRDGLELPVTFNNDWFVEFTLNDGACLSIADERRATVNSNRGAGITLSLSVDDISAAWKTASEKGLAPTPIRTHSWNARVFYLFDPDGHRIEFWEASGSIEQDFKNP